MTPDTLTLIVAGCGIVTMIVLTIITIRNIQRRKQNAQVLPKV